MTLEDKKKQLFIKLNKEYNLGYDLVEIIDEVVRDINQSELKSIYLIQQQILKKILKPNPKLKPPKSFFLVSSSECFNENIADLKNELLKALLPIYNGFLPIEELINSIDAVINKYPNLTMNKYFDLIKTKIFNDTRNYCIKRGNEVGDNTIKLLLRSRTLYLENEE